MRAGVRKLLLFSALAGVVGFLAFDRPPERAGVAPGVPVVGAERAKSSPESLQLPERGGLARVRGELFGAPPAPPPAKAGPAPVEAAPVAPPIPYRFAGKVFNGAEVEVLISKGDLVFPVKVGDLLDGMYRVESIGADGIELLYVPLGTRDRIAVSSVLEGVATALAAAPAPVAQPAAIQKSDGTPAKLRWEGPPQVQAGASFSVALRVNTREELRAVPMQLRFEPDLLEAVEVRPGKFFGQGSNFSYRVSPEGSIFVGATSQPAAPGADAELVIVTFRPLKRGTAELSMGALSLQGTAGRAISHERVSSFRTAIQ